MPDSNFGHVRSSRRCKELPAGVHLQESKIPVCRFAHRVVPHMLGVRAQQIARPRTNALSKVVHGNHPMLAAPQECVHCGRRQLHVPPQVQIRQPSDYRLGLVPLREFPRTRSALVNQRPRPEVTRCHEGMRGLRAFAVVTTVSAATGMRRHTRSPGAIARKKTMNDWSCDQIRSARCSCVCLAMNSQGQVM